MKGKTRHIESHVFGLLSSESNVNLLFNGYPTNMYIHNILLSESGDSNRPPRQRSDRERPQRSRELNQSADKPNHINDRQNRPPRQSTDQKEIDDLKNQRNREERFGNSGEVRYSLNFHTICKTVR